MLRDGVRVADLQPGDDAVRLSVAGRPVEASVLVGADGANGVVARTAGLADRVVRGVALEGNVRYGRAHPYAFAGRVILEFGVVPGGYGWVFPKGDHVNVGVGGWEAEGPRLRDHLRRLCAAHGLPFEAVEAIRGHRLPMRLPGARVARGRTLVVGDAAGLVDPFSGDGLYEAFLSARVAATAVGDVLAGRAETVAEYEPRLAAALGGLPAFSWRLKSAVDRFPRLSLAIVRLPPVWPVVEAVVRGELRHPGLARGPARVPVRALSALARRASAGAPA